MILDKGTVAPPPIRVCLAFMILLLNLAVSFALDPGKEMTQYVHDVWQTEDGLPQNTVYSILQTRDGYLWLGTEEGLARFDGVRFVVFNKQNTPAMKENLVSSLCEDHDGGLWIGTLGGGLTHFFKGKWSNFTMSEGLSNDNVRALLVDRQGTIWAGTYAGLDRLRDGKWRAYTTTDGLSSNKIRALYEDREGRLWVGTYDHGVSLLQADRWTSYSTKDGLSSDSVWAIYEDREGNIWIGTTGGGLNRLRDGKWTSYTSKEGASNNVLSIFQDHDGSLWIGTHGDGLRRFRNDRWSAFTTKDGLSSDNIRPIYEDREGSLWVGTQSGGLNRLRDGLWTSYTTKEGLLSSDDWTVYEDRSGSIWVGSEGGGVSRLQEGKWTSYTTDNGLSNNAVRSILQDRDGNIWVGTVGGGLNLLRGDRWSAYTTKNGLSNDTVWSICQRQSGDLWIGTNGGGLNLLRDGKWSTYTTRNGLSSDIILSIYEDSSRSLWAGMNAGGVCRLDQESKWRCFTKKDGLSNETVNSIYEDREGSLWLGTYGGLNRFHNHKWTYYTTREGLPDDTIFAVLEDNANNLWMSSNRGIFKIERKDLDAFDNGAIKHIPCLVFGKPDGMKSRECNGGEPAGWKTKNGRLWFATIEGVVVTDPAKTIRNRLKPPVHVEEVLVDGAPLFGPDQTSATTNAVAPPDRANPVEIQPGKKDFEFHYTALSLLVPDRVNFQYKLEGYDGDWIRAGTRRVAFYTNLAPGKYTFLVKACNNDGLWNDEAASLAFVLLPRFYRTSWFAVLCGIGAVAAIMGIFKVRVGLRLRQQRTRFETILAERTRISQDLHDSINQTLSGLGLQMRVIEVRNERGEPIEENVDAAKQMLKTAMVETHRLVEDLRPGVLEQSSNLSEALHKLAASLSNEESQRVVAITQASRVKTRQAIETVLFRVAQEALANAIKHSGASDIVLELSFDSGFILLKVQDNGRGFSKENASASTGRFGLAGMKERIETLRGTFKVESHEGKGTTIHVAVPLR